MRSLSLFAWTIQQAFSSSAADILEAFVAAYPEPTASKSQTAEELVGRISQSQDGLRRVSAGIRKFRKAENDCDRFYSLAFALGALPVTALEGSAPSQGLLDLQHALETQLRTFVHALMEDVATCKLTETQTKLQSLFEEQAAQSSLIRKVLHGKENAFFVFSLGLHFDLKFLSMHTLGLLIDPTSPSEWHTAIVFAAMTIQTTLWSDPDDPVLLPFSADTDQGFFPRQAVMELFNTVRNLWCAEDSESTLIVKSICRVVASREKLLGVRESVHDLSDVVGTLVRNIVNQPA